jgi:hypothetical protein
MIVFVTWPKSWSAFREEVKSENESLDSCPSAFPGPSDFLPDSRHPIFTRCVGAIEPLRLQADT